VHILVIIVVYALIITGEAGETFSEEVLESQNITFVPQLTSSKSENYDRLDKKQPPKVTVV
jgi:hypothetical protein